MQPDGSHAAGFSSAQHLLQPSCIYTAYSELVLQLDNRTKSIGLNEALRLIEGILVHTMSVIDTDYEGATIPSYLVTSRADLCQLG